MGAFSSKHYTSPINNLKGRFLPGGIAGNELAEQS
jgi:hypothetical protein